MNSARPKLAGRIVRFELARHMLAGTTHVSIAQVAAVCGFTIRRIPDQ